MPPELHFIIPAWGKNASVDAPRSSAPGTSLFVDMFSNVIIISCEDVIIRVCPQACLSSHVCGAHTTTITTMVTTTTTITAAPIPPPPPLPLLSIMVNLVVQVFVMLAPWLFRSRLGNGLGLSAFWGLGYIAIYSEGPAYFLFTLVVLLGREAGPEGDSARRLEREVCLEVVGGDYIR